MDRLEAFGQELRKARMSQGLSQEDLAERADLHRNFIGLIERGKTKPALDTIFSIADALGILASDLIARAEAEADLHLGPRT